MTEPTPRRRRSARSTASDVLTEIAVDAALSPTLRVRAARGLLTAAKASRRPPQPENEQDRIDDRAAEIAAAPATDRLPVIGEHRGIPIFDFQTESRIAETVRPEIDEALALEDPGELFAYAGDPRHAPEARLAAAAKFRALDEARVAAHVARIGGIERLDAAVAGIDSLTWTDPDRYCSLLDRAEHAARRAPEHRKRLIEAQEAESFAS